MSEALTQTEAAKRLGISRWKLRKLSDSNAVPRSKDGSYPWPAVREAFQAHESPDEETSSAEGPDEWLTQKEAAKRLAITTRQLRNLTEAPRDEETELYPWPGVRDWYIRFKQEEHVKRRGLDGSDGMGTFALARARKTAAEALLKELELARRRQELIPREDVMALVRTPLQAVDRRLREYPRKASKSLAKRLKVTEAVALELLEAMVEDVRGELRGVFGGEPSKPAAKKPTPRKRRASPRKAAKRNKRKR